MVTGPDAASADAGKSAATADCRFDGESSARPPKKLRARSDPCSNLRGQPSENGKPTCLRVSPSPSSSSPARRWQWPRPRITGSGKARTKPSAPRPAPAKAGRGLPGRMYGPIARISENEKPGKTAGLSPIRRRAGGHTPSVTKHLIGSPPRHASPIRSLESTSASTPLQ